MANLMVDFQMAVGLLGGTLTTAANMPQVWKTYKNRSGEGLSFWMLVTLGTGLALWVIYGIEGKSVPIVAANGAGLCLIASLIAMKLKFDSNPSKD
jgi:MtN3 and saliva related transmembrane protein